LSRAENSDARKVKANPGRLASDGSGEKGEQGWANGVNRVRRRSVYETEEKIVGKGRL